MATPKLPSLVALRNLATGMITPSATPGVPPGKSKIGMPSGPINRNQASAPEAQSSNASSARMSATTYFTQAPGVGQQSSILYSADRLWARVTLILETAGPVAVGFSSNLGPVTSGKGILLDTGVPLTLDISKGNVLYTQATSANRIKVIVQSVPWLEQIAGMLLAFGKAMGVLK